jgi:hypothetical protein
MHAEGNALRKAVRQATRDGAPDAEKPAAESANAASIDTRSVMAGGYLTTQVGTP